MGPEMFKEPSAGRVIPHPTGYYAFIPADLPPAITFDRDLVRAVVTITRGAFGRIAGPAGT